MPGMNTKLKVKFDPETEFFALMLAFSEGRDTPTEWYQGRLVESGMDSATFVFHIPVEEIPHGKWFHELFNRYASYKLENSVLKVEMTLAHNELVKNTSIIFRDWVESLIDNGFIFDLFLRV